MTDTTVLVATWQDGVFVVTGETVRREDHELGGQPIRALAHDTRPGHEGGTLAIVDRSLQERTADGEWSVIAKSDSDLACCLTVGDEVLVGTDDARLLRIDAEGHVEIVEGFDNAQGREAWYAGTAVIDGKVVGPPLGVRSLSVTADRSTLLANIHVGGIPRSTDGGTTWHATIDVDSDVHEVVAHPTDPRLVIAAAAAGLCVSRDGGATWTIEQEGLHATYCSAVAFAGDDLLIAAAPDHFSTEGAVYRRPVDGPGPLALPGGGLPHRIEGIADTRCLASSASGSTLAVADRGGSLYVSEDGGASWARRAEGLPGPSSVLVGP